MGEGMSEPKGRAETLYHSPSHVPSLDRRMGVSDRLGVSVVSLWVVQKVNVS